MVTVETLFYSSEVNFERKNPVLPIEKFPFIALARNTMMLQQLIIHFSLHYLSSGHLWEFRNKENFQTFSSRSDRGSFREVLATGGSTVLRYSNLRAA